MTLAHTSRATGHASMFAALSIGAVILFADANPAAAFCVENRTQARLFFTARLKGEADKGLIFRRWVEGGNTACGAPRRGPGILEVSVFAAEDSVEGCGDEIAAEGTLRLQEFSQFDNCIWDK
ncbi:hypothetical protein BMS3Bbin10_00649 [bacterium BMS3Bbin10]|nr:hypothetical protein BMS3Bbin10_00649 [bacterium BMS3Bbin10]HDL17329.1 hypothetical protein [Hyphomicrobiales bacterium]